MHYLSILVHHHNSKACKNYTKKCVNLRQNSLKCVLYAKKYIGSKKYPNASCVVGTNISYVSYNEIEIQMQIQICTGWNYSLSYKEIVLVVVQNINTILSDTITKYILWRNYISWQFLFQTPTRLSIWRTCSRTSTKLSWCWNMLRVDAYFSSLSLSNTHQQH